MLASADPRKFDDGRLPAGIHLDLNKQALRFRKIKPPSLAHQSGLQLSRAALAIGRVFRIAAL
jgi:hypothetical protein